MDIIYKFKWMQNIMGHAWISASLKNKNVSGNAIVFGRTSYNPIHCLFPDEDGSDNSTELMDDWVFTKLLRKPDYKLFACMRALRMKHLVFDIFAIELFSFFFNLLKEPYTWLLSSFLFCFYIPEIECDC